MAFLTYILFMAYSIFTQAASLLQKIYKILQRTCITLCRTLYSGLHSIFSPDLATEALELLLSITNEKKKISSILLLNYLNVFQFVKYLHISLFIDGFKGVSSTTIGYFLIRQTEFGGFAH